MALRRLQKELHDIGCASLEQTASAPSWSAGPTDDDFFTWQATISPRSGAFVGGIFFFELEFPRDYPFKPPKFRIISFENGTDSNASLFHPLVGSTGSICDCGIRNVWSPTCSISTIINFLTTALEDVSNPDGGQLSVPTGSRGSVPMCVCCANQLASECMKKSPARWLARARAAFTGEDARLLTLFASTNELLNVVDVDCSTSLTGEILLKLQIPGETLVHDLLEMVYERIPGWWQILLPTGEDLETIACSKTVSNVFGFDVDSA